MNTQFKESFTKDLRKIRDKDLLNRAKTVIFPLDEDLAERLTAIARAKRIPSKTLINEWLREKVLEQREATL